jgi:hypothetical protein
VTAFSCGLTSIVVGEVVLRKSVVDGGKVMRGYQKHVSLSRIEFHQMVQYLAVPVLEPETSPCQAV